MFNLQKTKPFAHAWTKMTDYPYWHVREKRGNFECAPDKIYNSPPVESEHIPLRGRIRHNSSRVFHKSKKSKSLLKRKLSQAIKTYGRIIRAREKIRLFKLSRKAKGERKNANGNMPKSTSSLKNFDEVPVANKDVESKDVEMNQTNEDDDGNKGAVKESLRTNDAAAADAVGVAEDANSNPLDESNYYVVEMKITNVTSKTGVRDVTSYIHEVCLSLDYGHIDNGGGATFDAPNQRESTVEDDKAAAAADADNDDDGGDDDGGNDDGDKDGDKDGDDDGDDLNESMDDCGCEDENDEDAEMADDDDSRSSSSSTLSSSSQPGGPSKGSYDEFEEVEENLWEIKRMKFLNMVTGVYNSISQFLVNVSSEDQSKKMLKDLEQALNKIYYSRQEDIASIRQSAGLKVNKIKLALHREKMKLVEKRLRDIEILKRKLLCQKKHWKVQAPVFTRPVVEEQKENKSDGKAQDEENEEGQQGKQAKNCSEGVQVKASCLDGQGTLSAFESSGNLLVFSGESTIPSDSMRSPPPLQ